MFAVYVLVDFSSRMIAKVLNHTQKSVWHYIACICNNIMVEVLTVVVETRIDEDGGGTSVHIHLIYYKIYIVYTMTYIITHYSCFLRVV